VQEKLKLLRKFEVSVNDSLESVCELIASKLKSDKNTLLQTLIKDEVKKVQEIQTLFYEIENLIHEIKKMTCESK